MKPVRLFLLILCLAIVALGGCSQPAQETAATSNSDISVELLFTHDGVKVYRFYDYGHAVYFTDARGGTSWEQSDGKSSYPMTVPTRK